MFILRKLLIFFLLGSIILPLQSASLFSKQMSLMVDGNSRTLYYESNHDINITDNSIQRLIVIVHGSSRTNTTYERILNASIANNINSQTFILAPQFLIDDDIAENTLGSEALFWSGGWRQGHLSKNNGLGRISSFELVNQIVTDVATNNSNITDVVIIGHSAGGQYAQRFAATSQLEQSLTAVIPGVKVRYIPANPSSMVYMDNKRRVADTVDQFAVPNSSNCPDYDEYKYGLSSNLNSFVSTTGVTQVRAQYPLRDVRYLLGENDNDPNNSSLDTSCEANLQGQQRLERGIIFYNYIRDYFGESVHNKHVMAMSANFAHTSSIFIGPCGLSFIFDIGSCNYTTPTHLSLTIDNNSGSVNLTWMDRAEGEDNYQVERSDNGGSTFSLLTTLSTSSVSYTDVTASASTQYHYRVRTSKGFEHSAYSNVAIANANSPLPQPPVTPPAPTPTPQPTPAPSNSSGGGGSINLFLLLPLILLSRKNRAID